MPPLPSAMMRTPTFPVSSILAACGTARTPPSAQSSEQSLPAEARASSSRRSGKQVGKMHVNVYDCSQTMLAPT